MKSKVSRGWGLENASPADRLAVARDYVRQHAPYFCKILYGLSFVPVEGLGTLCTTRNLVCGYDPAYVAQTETDVVAADLAHEILHVLGKHFDRLGACKDQKLANIAADLPINVDLHNATPQGKLWRLHPTAVFPKHFNLPEGKTAEQYYELLLKEKLAGRLSTHTCGKDPEKGDGGKQPGVGSGNCGSIAGNKDHPALAAMEGRSEVERTAMVMQVAAAMKEHVARHGRGALPASLVDWLDVMNKPSRRNWRDHLATLLRNCTGRIQSGGDDYSISRPSKRSFLRGMIRPGLIENLPVVGFVLDSSGSMGTEQLNAAMVEALSILEALGIDEVWFAEADAAVALQFKTIGGSTLRKLKIVGRGGTDFRPAIVAAEKLNPCPDLLIYFTDGDGYAPTKPPRGMEVVWCIVPSHYNRRPAKWGHAVLVSEDPNQQLRPPLQSYDDA